MTDERRYRDEEIEEIFAIAASAEDSRRPALSSGEGMTLAELQEIGSEADLAPERIAEAAATLDLRRNVLPRRTHLGMPISVGRIVDLPRAPTDREWELLVVQLRETFNARGHVASHGDLREWTNGGLHAYVEPTESGHRIRLGTLKSGAVGQNWLGIGGLVAGVLGMVGSSWDVNQGLLGAALIAGMGGALLALNVLSLPRWADRREKQMERIAGLARAMIESRPSGQDLA